MGSEPAERLGGLLRADLLARKALEDLAWAILTGREFLFTH